MESDADLVKTYLAGDERALKKLVERHTPALYNFVYRFTGDSEDAADVVQETVLKAWKHLAKYRTEQNFRTWLFTIARNTAIDWLRKKRSVPFSMFETTDESGAFNDTLADPLPLAEEVAALAEDKVMLEKALVALSPAYRDVLLLRYQNDFTFDEIGAILGKPLHTVKSQHRRALIILRDILAKRPRL
ncbi:sigma-70 family RNA polymerase sigma factor [Patescibacteria group bacterium]|nr:sigma-70 family RNA polymerase sigma factor [Patescibacteria group bacterium]